MTKRKSPNWLENIALIVLFSLLSLGSASGAYQFYYLHIQSTGVTFRDTGKPASRAKLLDMIIVSAIQSNRTDNAKTSAPATPVPVAPASGK